MSLTTNFETRYSTQIVRTISNPQNSGATTKDSARIALAETDVKSKFKNYVGVVYDDDNADHVAVAVTGMELTLLSWTTQDDESVKRRYDQWMETLKDYSRTIGGRSRIVPSTTSQTVRTAETTSASSTPPKPAFDSSVFVDSRTAKP